MGCDWFVSWGIEVNFCVGFQDLVDGFVYGLLMGVDQVVVV